jgi:hypothetical protein
MPITFNNSDIDSIGKHRDERFDGLAWIGLLEKRSTPQETGNLRRLKPDRVVK